jgi:hypothetical protein
LGYLKAVAKGNLERHQRLAKLEEISAAFGYPPEMQGLSPYHVFALRGRGEVLDDPEVTLQMLISRLEQELS